MQKTQTIDDCFYCRIKYDSHLKKKDVRVNTDPDYEPKPKGEYFHSLNRMADRVSEFNTYFPTFKQKFSSKKLQ